jgi:hypothetical protein
MSIRKTINVGDGSIVVGNDYGYTSINSFSGNRYGPSVIITLPNEAVTDLVAALLDVQEDSAANEAASRD